MVARRRKKAAALLGIYLLLKKCRSTKRSCRRKSWVALRDELGAYSNLVRELQVEGTLRNYLDPYDNSSVLQHFAAAIIHGHLCRLSLQQNPRQFAGVRT